MSAVAQDDWIERAAENWKAGVRAAASKTAAHREAARAVAVANRAEGQKRPCGIKGCKRSSYKGRLCRKHYELVPWELKIGLYCHCIAAEMRAAERWHRRYLPAVRAILAKGEAA